MGRPYGERRPSDAELDGGSFRDPDSRVFYSNGGVFRALSAQGLADWDLLASSRFFSELVAAGKLIGTRAVPVPAGLPSPVAHNTAAALAHETVPFVSYPYEWPFGMLKDAALLQLEILRTALDEGLILKDSSPYNVQWRGARPVFIDVGSFERLRDGEPWIGYRQFCMLFLYPLMLQAYKGVGYQPWLRGRLEGITPAECASLMSRWQLFRRGVLTHVYLHARLERRYSERDANVGSELRAAGFRSELIKANVRRLERLVRGLDWRPSPSAWLRYGDERSYSDHDARQKDEIVRRVAASKPWSLVWDLGCNDGRYSRIAAESAEYVVAMDSDAGVVESLYRALETEGDATVLPLIVDLVDQPPGLGWRARERRPLLERGRPDLILCLALLHHLCITGNVPLAEAVDWLRSLGGSVLVEFVDVEDAMVQRLLSAKRAGSHPDYGRQLFEERLSEAFDIERRDALASGTRTLYFATPR